MTTSRSALHSFPLLLSLFTAVFGTSLSHAQLPQPVMTQDGLVQGALSAEGSAISVFRGLPYAAPPVGANRWREPQAVAAWSGIRSAEQSASRCVQNGFAPGADQPLSSEDCLYLNVWTPAQSADAKLPVMVWIHGGGFFGGAGSQATYDGENLAGLGAVVVTINYRLGSFGFLAHPELTAESPNHSSGNYGLLDMIAALQWVQNNATAFGGDAGNVTVVGESVGAQAIGVLIASPLTAGLFHHAILQSSSWMGLSINKQATLAERESLEQQQVAKLGLNSIAELRLASAQQIFENFPNNGAINVDGYLLPRDASLIYADGTQQPVDVLAGSNANEGVFFGPGLQTMQEVRDYANGKYGDLAKNFFALYPLDNDQQANQSYLKSYSAELAWNMRKLGDYQNRAGRNGFVYFFTHVPPGQEARGATHVAELAYMFNQHEQNAAWTDVDKQLGAAMAQFWVNFATSGNPNGGGVSAWPQYRDNAPGSVMVLGDTAAPETIQVPSAAELEFYESAYARHVELLK